MKVRERHCGDGSSTPSFVRIGTVECPSCVSPVIAAAVIVLQDAHASWRAAIITYLPRLIGSRGTQEREVRRGYACADWAMRVIAPLTLEAVRLTEQASALRQLAPLADEPTVEAALAGAGTAVEAAEDAYDAANAAAPTAVVTRAFAAVCRAIDHAAYAAHTARVAACTADIDATYATAVVAADAAANAACKAGVLYSLADGTGASTEALWPLCADLLEQLLDEGVRYETHERR